MDVGHASIVHMYKTLLKSIFVCLAVLHAIGVMFLLEGNIDSMLLLTMRRRKNDLVVVFSES